MIVIPPATRIYLALPATDMRKSFDGLRSLVQRLLLEDPLSGAIFVFINKRRDRLKLLWWEPDGFSLYYKRLEEGTYQSLPALTDEQGNPVPQLELTPNELKLLLAGIDLKVRRRKRYQRPDPQEGKFC